MQPKHLLRVRHASLDASLVDTAYSAVRLQALFGLSLAGTCKLGLTSSEELLGTRLKDATVRFGPNEDLIRPLTPRIRRRLVPVGVR